MIADHRVSMIAGHRVSVGGGRNRADPRLVFLASSMLDSRSATDGGETGLHGALRCAPD